MSHVQFPDALVAKELLREFRRRHGMSVSREVKFEGLDSAQRLDILRDIRAANLQVAVAVIDKQSIKTPVQQLKSGALYKRSVALAISHGCVAAPVDHVLVDNYFNSKQRNRQFVSDLRHLVNGKRENHERLANEFSVGDSRLDPGLQAADVVAGAVNRYYRDGDNRYRIILASVLDECFWLENE